MTKFSCQRIKVIFSIFLATIFSTNVFAQRVTEITPNWELGVDLYSLIRPAEPQLFRSSYGVILKRKIKEDGALRFRTNFGFDFMTDPTVKGTNQPRTYNLGFDLGYEKQNQYKKFIHYFGIDGQFKYFRSNSTIGLGVSGNDPTFFNDKGRTIGAAIAPFTGGKYMITPRIAIAMETNISLMFLKYRNTTRNVDINNEPVTEEVETGSSNGIWLNIQPLSALYLSYYF